MTDRVVCRCGTDGIADDADTVRRRVREQLALGASQIKLMAGGGVGSSYDPLDVTRYTVAESLARSGPRNPYSGTLGVVQEGALADLLLVDGNPIANITLVDDPAKNFLVIVKDGKIFKNLLR